ncbi:class I SAM-dependent methyltransferase [soil metagenome]|jgi:SAM-dependent methyltransferase
MTADAVDLYDAALRTGDGRLAVRVAGGRPTPLDVQRWCGQADAADLDLLARRHGPTLDVGCGPGRLLAALAGLGVPAVGVDIAAYAVSLAAETGQPVLHRSVFDRLPGEGGWGTVLLADGNIGIGGDPETLLRRVSELLAPGGRALVEVAAYDVQRTHVLRVEDGAGRRSKPFLWGRLGGTPALRLAESLGFDVAERWTAGGRCFLTLTSPAECRSGVQPLDVRPEAGGA